ncbi:MAG: protein translocase SEC61 complex subunit gamma [Candidatus Aenigmarchaeota archaeon]|nr:protein translocase SEC61 complex subunit gamma [Candidatus Aenigmarchaeota archaeon]
MKLDFKGFLKKLSEYKRILKIAKKPTGEDLLFMIKISAIGIALLGTIGFVIYIISSLFLG